MWFVKRFINKIKNKISEDYNDHRSYFFAKLFVAGLMLPNIVLSLWDIILWIFGRELEWYLSGRFLILFLFSFLWLIFDGIVESIFLKSWKITANMKELPKNVWSKNTIIEYNLSENITPSEAGMLLYWRAEISNMLCLIYKWINEKKIILYVENGKKYLKRVQWLDDWVHYYEKFLFWRIFHNTQQPILFNKKLLNAYKEEFNDKVVKSCIVKWYINNNINPKGVNRLLVSESDVSENKPIRKRNFSIWCLLFLFLFPWFVIASNLGGFWELLWIVLFLIILINYLNNTKYYINLTDKWKEILSQIYWYKYYLEHCEEEQINSDLWDGEIYSKHLPYAIALKLNWKIIKELS